MTRTTSNISSKPEICATMATRTETWHTTTHNLVAKAGQTVRTQKQTIRKWNKSCNQNILRNKRMRTRTAKKKHVSKKNVFKKTSFLPKTQDRTKEKHRIAITTRQNADVTFHTTSVNHNKPFPRAVSLSTFTQDS